MRIYRKILVVCPAGAVTGGPEALHQLVDHMNHLGLPAFIVYLPFTKPAQVPEPYEKYNAPIANYEDEEGALIIFPEVYPMLALAVRRAQAAIWWLSLDNFLERRHISPLRDAVRYLKRIIKRQRPLRGAKDLKRLIHFSQTEHASRYLRSCGITPIDLIDSINEDFLKNDDLKLSQSKEDVILYNPTKGKKITDYLMKMNPQWKFIPLKGLNREELSQKLLSAKVYIDFGHHPGRDRLPREAAMHGCCLVTGLLGSAGNSVDLPINERYKLNSDSHNFCENFQMLIQDIFLNYEYHHGCFDEYRKWLKNEPRLFKQQIANYFLDSKQGEIS